jgi:GT2 family glycosyltransferase
VNHPPGTPPEVSVAIATISGPLEEPCLSLLRSLKEHTPEPHEICIVDNGSAPQGYPKPVNAAIRAASAPYLAILNDDIRVYPGWWPPLRQALENGATLAFPNEINGNNWADGLFNMFAFAISRANVDRFAWRPGRLYEETYTVHNADTALTDRIVLRGEGTSRVFVPESNVEHLQGQTMFGNPAITPWALERIAEDTALREERFTEPNWAPGEHWGIDEPGWVDPGA